MGNGVMDLKSRRRRVLAGALALTVAGSLAACTTEQQVGRATTVTETTKAPAVKHFGPDTAGKLAIGMTEKEALATGELQTSPVSTVLGKNIYSFVDGPEPDPKRMAADAK